MSKKQKRTMSKQAFGITITGRGSSRRLAKRAMWLAFYNTCTRVRLLNNHWGIRNIRYKDPRNNRHLAEVKKVFLAFKDADYTTYDLFDFFSSYWILIDPTTNLQPRQLGKSSAQFYSMTLFLEILGFYKEMGFFVDGSKKGYRPPTMFYPEKESTA